MGTPVACLALAGALGQGEAFTQLGAPRPQHAPGALAGPERTGKRDGRAWGTQIGMGMAEAHGQL